MRFSSTFVLLMASFAMACAQHAVADVLVLKNGKTYQGELISESPTEVVFHGKIAGIWSMVTFERSRIESIKREPGDQGPSSEPKASPSKAPQQRSPTRTSNPSDGAEPGTPANEQAGGDDSRKGPEEPANRAPLVEVKVRGSGATSKAAFDDAIRAALIQVAGTFVRSDTKVENDKIVEDKIIAHSQGFIERAEKIGNPRLEDGVYTQEALVVVRVSELSEALTANASLDAAVDGQSLYARVRAMRDQSASAADLVRAVFDGFPGNVLSCEVAEGPAPVDPKSFRVELDDSEVLILVKVDIWVDPEKWRAWCKGASEALRAIAAVKETRDWNPKKAGAKRVSAKTGVGDAFIKSFAGLMSDKTAKAEHLLLNRVETERLADEVATLSQVRDGADSQDSLKVGHMSDRDLRFVCILPQAGGRLEVYGLTSDVTEEWGLPWGVPQLHLEIQDESGASLGAFENSSRSPYALDGKGVERWCAVRAAVGIPGPFMSASPAFPPGFFSPDFFLLMPYLLSCDQHSPTKIASARITLPCRFIMTPDELERVKRVSVKLGATRSSITPDGRRDL